MPRQARIEYAGAFYHVMARGDRREAICLDNDDRAMFVATLGEACLKTGWQVYAWVLMSNHYHWVLHTPQANLVAGMRWFQNTFTRRLNTRHRLWGHVFGGRYKAILVEGNAPSSEDRLAQADYLTAVMDYVHLNPARAGLVDPAGGTGALEYPWSSLAKGYGLSPKQRPGWMAVEKGLEAFGWKDRVGHRRKFVERLEGRVRAGETGVEAASDGQSLQSTLRRGWYWGNQQFRETLLEFANRLKAPLRSNPNYRSSALGKDDGQRQAEKWLAKGLEHFRLNKSEAGTKWEGNHHRERVMIAWGVATRTEIAQQWIADKLGLVSAGNVSQQVRRWRQRMKRDPCSFTVEARTWITTVNSL